MKDNFSYIERMNSVYRTLYTGVSRLVDVKRAINGTLFEVINQGDNNVLIKVHGYVNKEYNINLKEVIINEFLETLIKDCVRKEDSFTFTNDDFNEVVDVLDKALFCTVPGEDNNEFKFNHLNIFSDNNGVYIVDDNVRFASVKNLEVDNSPLSMGVERTGLGKYVEAVEMIEFVTINNSLEIDGDVWEKSLISEFVNNIRTRITESLENIKENTPKSLNRVLVVEETGLILLTDMDFKKFSLVRMKDFDILESRDFFDGGKNNIKLTLNNAMWEIAIDIIKLKKKREYVESYIEEL